jgi:gamma-glutamyltranspeptidase/glutathione hydrolase
MVVFCSGTVDLSILSSGLVPPSNLCCSSSPYGSLCATTASFCNCGGNRPTGAPFATRSPVLSTRGSIASAHPLASQAGLDILKAGGSAVDAAIATNLVLAVLEPMMNGPGGDLMAIVYLARNQTLIGYNGAGRSSASFSLSQMRAELNAISATQIPSVGPLTVTVPGAPRGWCDLHSRFGKLPFNELFTSAIYYAQNGAPVPQIIANEWDVIEDSPALTSGGLFPNAREGYISTFLPKPSEGTHFANPALATTLTLIANGGCDAFYSSGPIPDAIEKLQDTAGLKLTRDDLLGHVGEWVNPVSTTYRDAIIYELPPNLQGIAALEMLNILENFNFSVTNFNSADYLHAHIEAKKLAFSDASTFVADPAFVNVPIDSLISKSYAATRRALINMSSAARTDSPGKPSIEDSPGGDTTYLVAADADGNIVSLIQSIYTGFGSGLVSPTLGFALQSRGSLFSVKDGAANIYAPNKRPYHTIMPGMATRGSNWTLGFGVMGGFMQPQGHVQILSNLIDSHMNVQEAGDAARYYHSGSSDPMGNRMSDGGIVQLEGGVCDAVIADLTQRGHNIVRGSNAGGYQAILSTTDKITGQRLYACGTEMRKDGLCAAY